MVINLQQVKIKNNNIYLCHILDLNLKDIVASLIITASFVIIVLNLFNEKI